MLRLLIQFWLLNLKIIFWYFYKVKGSLKLKNKAENVALQNI